MIRALVIACALVGAAVPARAEPAGTVALLPLDAEARLAIYGQPVASEIARALGAGGLDVVVVGPNMAVPERARLIVGGAIHGRGDAVALELQVRNPVDGAVLDRLDASAPTIAAIDRAAAELSARLLPVVRARLAALATVTPRPTTPVSPVRPAPAPRPVLVAIGAPPDAAVLGRALDAAVGAALRRNQRAPTTVRPDALAPSTAVKTVGAAHADRGVLVEVLGYDVSSHRGVPLGRARVRVRIAGASAIDFDRVVVTDTVVGDRGLAPDALAARVAREVLAILRPHWRRLEPGWR